MKAGSERDALRATVQLLSGRIYGPPIETELESADVKARGRSRRSQRWDDGVGLAEAAIAVDNLAFMRVRLDEAHAVGRPKPCAMRSPPGASREATEAAGDLPGLTIVGPLPFDEFPAIAESAALPRRAAVRQRRPCAAGGSRPRRR